AYDVYLAIRARVDARVQAALGRNTPNWRLKNACAPCMYIVCLLNSSLIAFLLIYLIPRGKYRFAITDHLIRVLGELGLGYDIGCKFGTMIKSLPSLGKLAKDNNFKSLVGSFHGCAHNRRCQLENLATYVKGMGLEDLEG
ncbi:hypothetical protein C8R43DRAFT_819925, partial [Mycena crocata]